MNKTSAETKLETVNVKKFGAKGDGITDDYNSILRAVNYLNKIGSGHLYFPPGKYILMPFHTKRNNVSDIIFKNCKNVTVSGTKAVILVNGSFNRSSDYKKGKYSYSYTSAVIPLSFNNCENVSVEGLELSGNVNLMTRDIDVVESGGHLLKFIKCSNVKVKNTLTHHAQGDGIYINNKCSDFIFTNVKSFNNARQGLSIMDLINGKFENCSFSNNGKTEGKYEGHAPRAGVDIEPFRGNGQIVKNLSFLNCKFIGNVGSQFICSQPLTTSGIRLSNCTIDAGQGASNYQMILTARDVKIEKCIINVGKGNIYPVWGEYSGSDVQIQSSIIRSSGKGILAISNHHDNKLLLKGNYLIFTGKTLKSYFPYLQMRNLTFVDNKVEIPAAALKPNAVSSLVQRALNSSGNVFQSDKIGIKPKVSYKGTNVIKD